MAVTAYKFPTNAHNESGTYSGSTAWGSVSSIQADDAAYATGNTSTSPDDNRVIRASLVFNGVIDESNNEASANAVGALGTQDYGGASDLWGATITPADVNRKHFGVALAYGKRHSGVDTVQTMYIVADDFDFDIPNDATIDGIEVRIEHQSAAVGGGSNQSQIDYVKMRINYTWATKVRAKGKAKVGVFLAEIPNQQMPKRKLRHLIYDKNDNFIGEWNDVSSETSFKRDMNNFLSTMSLKLARNDLIRFPSLQNLTDYNDENVLDHNDSPILTALAAGEGIGENTSLDTNLYYKLMSYYGKFDVLTDNEGRVVTDNNLSPIKVTDGAPGGREMFNGFISDWEADWGNTDDTDVNILSHSHDLKEIMFETADTIAVSNETQTGALYTGLAGAGPGDQETIAQNWIMSGNKNVSSIAINLRKQTTDDPFVTLSLYAGTPNSHGALIAESTVQIGNTDFAWVSFPFGSAVALTNTTEYTIIITTTSYKTGGNPTYPVQLALNSSYGSGVAWSTLNGSSTYTTNSTYDLLFRVYEAGGLTSVPFTATDVAMVFRAIADFAIARGARIDYDPAEIEPTGVYMTYTFNTNNCLEALQKCMEYVNADNFIGGFRPSDNHLFLKARPTTPSHYITNKRNFTRFRFGKSIKNLINDVYYSGGGSPKAFVRESDNGSIIDIRRGLGKFSDPRATLNAQLTILANAQINRNNSAMYGGTVTLIDDEDTYVEDYDLCELLGLSNFPLSFMNTITLLVASLKYNGDTVDIDLEVLRRKPQQDVKDLNNQLEVVEQNNNPTSPA